MKCQAWVDPAKFNKKDMPSPRAFIGSYTLDVARYLGEVKGTLHAKRVAQMERALRCGGHLTVSIYADSDEEGYTGKVEVEVYCDDCHEYNHLIGLNAEVVEQWIQERLDATE